MEEGYSYSKEIFIQSMDKEFSSSSFLWLCRETWRCIVATSVIYFMLWKKIKSRCISYRRTKQAQQYAVDKKNAISLTVWFYREPTGLSAQWWPTYKGNYHLTLYISTKSLYQRGKGGVYQSMSLVSLVNIHASSNSIIAPWQDPTK